MKNSVFIFLNKIEPCHLNNHSQKNEVNVIRTFWDIEVQNWRFGIFCKIGKEWDRIYGADYVFRWTINDEIHCSYA